MSQAPGCAGLQSAGGCWGGRHLSLRLCVAGPASSVLAKMQWQPTLFCLLGPEDFVLKAEVFAAGAISASRADADARWPGPSPGLPVSWFWLNQCRFPLRMFPG